MGAERNKYLTSEIHPTANHESKIPYHSDSREITEGMRFIPKRNPFWDLPRMGLADLLHVD